MDCTDLTALVEMFAEVMNDHDIDGTLDLFTDDAVVRLPVNMGPKEFYGKEQIRTWLEDVFDNNVEITNIHDCKPDGNTVTCHGHLHLSRLSRLHIDPAESVNIITCRDGKISSFVGQLEGESLLKLQKAVMGQKT